MKNDQLLKSYKLETANEHRRSLSMLVFRNVKRHGSDRDWRRITGAMDGEAMGSFLKKKEEGLVRLLHWQLFLSVASNLL